MTSDHEGWGLRRAKGPKGPNGLGNSSSYTDSAVVSPTSVTYTSSAINVFKRDWEWNSIVEAGWKGSSPS